MKTVFQRWGRGLGLLAAVAFFSVAAPAHDTRAKGEGYNSIKYSATLSLFVPQICPCCGG